MSRKSLKEQIYDNILDSIESGEFPIDVFLKEGDLAERYNVSKAPVREALVQLCNEQVIRNIPRTGYQITHLTQKDFFNATQLRLILEVEGVKISLPKISETDLQKIHEVILDTHYADDQDVTVREWWEGNKRFHLLLCSFAGNSLLVETLNRTFNILLRAIMQIFSNDAPGLYLHHDPKSHFLIEAAIREKNPDMLIALLSKDILSIPQFYPMQP